MTREEKIERFNELCGLIGDTLLDCHKCPDFVNELCNKKTAENFTDEELDAALEELEKTIQGMNDFDAVSRPAHYTKTSIECIDAMIETQGVEAVKAFCVCNAFKYLWRHNEKNGDEDIKKASWYLNKAVELMGRSQHEN